MKKKLLLLCITLISCATLYAQIPGTITYQGYLTDATGKPKSGTHKLTFNFYDASNAVVATRVISTVNVTNGLFTEIIGKDASGENASLPLTVWNKPILVGIAVDTETELPKISLTSMPYAFTAQVANSVDGANITGTVNASKIGGTLIASNIPSLDASKITTGTLATSTIPNLDASKITTGTVSNTLLDTDLQDLADGSLSGSKVGSGVAAANITGTLAGSQVGSGVSATNITGTLAGSQVGTGISAANVSTGTLPLGVLGHLTDGTLGSLSVSGYTQLGTGAPSIQTKVLTGTTNAAQGGQVLISHGLTVSKILSVFVLVEPATDTWYPPNFLFSPGLEFYWYLTSVSVKVTNSSTNSSNILSKPISVFITYQQ